MGDRFPLWSGMHRREERWAYLFIAPQLLGLVLFVLGPVLATLGLSFAEWDLISAPRWVGLANYTATFAADVFWVSWRNTLVFVVATVSVGTVLALLLALALNERLPGRTLFRGVYFLPVVTSTVAIALVWQWLFQPEFGLFNQVLNLVGLPSVPWLSSLTWALPSVILMTIWHSVGYSMVIFLAGLQGVPQHLAEAAAIDGANRWQRFRHVTLPLLSPTTFFIVVTSTIGMFQAFNQVFVMTGGGPADATRLILLHIYTLAFRVYEIGNASAVSWMLFLLLFGLTAAQFAISRRWVHYG